MAGKEDLQILSSFIFSQLAGGDTEKEVEGIGAVLMNRATSMGSLTEAIDSIGVNPNFQRVMAGDVKEQESNDYKKVVQLTSRLLRGKDDVTGGAFYYFPKKNKPGKESGLKKTYATKSYNFYRPGVPELPTQS